MTTVAIAAPARAKSVAIERVPWMVWTSALATVSAAVGGLWDISWHISIGRDTFWTPPHMLIQLCAIIGGVTSIYLIARSTFVDNTAADHTVRILGLRAPLGAFLCGWGALAMLTSAPFDNWWHAAYGLDVKVISPPHALLMAGSAGVIYGGFLLIMAQMSNAADAVRDKIDRIFLFLFGVLMMAGHADLIEFSNRVLMHSAMFYRAFCIPYPLQLMVVRTVSKQRWACTITAGIYTGLALGQEWILPLFPAEQKLSPVYNRVPHMVPIGFPVLVIVPALFFDLLWPRLRTWKFPFRAASAGIVFLATFIFVQWPLADFLVSPRSADWFFGTHYRMYMIPADSPVTLGQFIPDEGGLTALAIGLLIAGVTAMLTSALGMGIGAGLRQIRR